MTRYFDSRKNPLEKIKALIKALPEKDAVLADKFLAKRDFQSIMELTEADLQKLMMNNKQAPDDHISNLIRLKEELSIYVPNLDAFYDALNDEYYY